MQPVQSIESLRARFRGSLIHPADAAYETARRVYNAMIDKRPRYIVRCADTADVMAAVGLAREHQLRPAVRGGSHSACGLGTCDDGLVIDLSGMRGIRVNPAARTVRVDGGCTWGDVDHATHAFGMAVPAGVISTTGVGGLTLGGGLGHLTRKYGLTIDNLLAADVVLANGRFVTASSAENPDLFWALRGGGGNFGVVTSFLFRMQPVDTVLAGPTFWSLEQADAVLHAYREFIPKAPEDINGFFAFLTVPPAPQFPAELHMKKMCGIVWCCTGDARAAEALIAPMRKFGRPAFDMAGVLPFPAVQSMFDALYPAGLQSYWKADFVNELSDAAIALHVQHAAKLPTMLSTMHLYPIDGAAHRAGPDETAFSYRDAQWAEVIVGFDPDPAMAGTISTWARSYWDALHPYSSGGAYINFMMDEGQDRIRATYRGNYQRLAAVKKKYDPTNFFSVNQNIRPA